MRLHSMVVMSILSFWLAIVRHIDGFSFFRAPPKVIFRSSSFSQNLLLPSTQSPFLTTSTCIKNVGQVSLSLRMNTAPLSSPTKRKSRKYSTELKDKIKTSVRAHWYQEKICKAYALGMTVEEFDMFRRNVIREYNKKYRNRITVSAEEHFRRRSNAVRTLWNDPTYKAKTIAARKAYYKCAAMVKVMIAKSLQKLWLKIPFPSSLSKEERRQLLSKVASIRLNKTIQIIDEEDIDRIKEQKEIERKKKLSAKIKQQWENPDYRRRVVETRKLNCGNKKVRTFSPETKKKLSLAMKSVWERRRPPNIKPFLNESQIQPPRKKSINSNSTEFIKDVPRRRTLSSNNKDHTNSTLTTEPRKRGRPPSSNKKHHTNCTLTGEPRKRGRPFSLHKKDHANCTLTAQTRNRERPQLHEMQTDSKDCLKVEAQVSKLEPVDTMEANLFSIQEPKVAAKRPDRRSILAEVGQEAIKVYRDKRLVGIYTREEYENLMLKVDSPT